MLDNFVLVCYKLQNDIIQVFMIGDVKMLKIIICGYSGKMGKTVTSVAMRSNKCEIVAGVDRGNHSAKNQEFPAFSSFESLKTNGIKADVIIDFSHPTALLSILEYARQKVIPLVLCTTGYSKEQLSLIADASQILPIFYSRNMSVGINLMIELTRIATEFLGNDFDIEIIEKHHNQKIDAPSGTAFMLAEEVRNSLSGDVEFVYDRHSIEGKRRKNEVGIHSIRGGNIVGEHEVIFAGQNETLTLTHTANSKEIYALGAIRAAEFLCQKNAGLYTMKNLINSI